MSYPEQFISVFARNCKVVKIDRSRASDFLCTNHRFGWSKCRYCYALVVERSGKDGIFCPGDTVAVSTFSNARRWTKDNKVVRSYEWVRYASLKGVRVCGGMGKMLSHFIGQTDPDDIMTYAPLTDENAGEVYTKLGFSPEGIKDFGEGKSLKFRLKIRQW